MLTIIGTHIKRNINVTSVFLILMDVPNKAK